MSKALPPTLHKHIARTYVGCILAALFLEGCAYVHAAHLTSQDVLIGSVLALNCLKEVSHLIITHIWEEL